MAAGVPKWPLALSAANIAILRQWAAVFVGYFRILGVLVIWCPMRGPMMVTLTMMMVVAGVYIVYIVDNERALLCHSFHGLARYVQSR